MREKHPRARRSRQIVALGAVSALVFQSCAVHAAPLPSADSPTSSSGAPAVDDDPCNNRAAIVGGVVGALLGGLLGSKLGKGNGKKVATVAGAVGGGTLGAYIGHNMDARRCAVFKLSQQYQYQVDVTPVRTDLSAATDASGAPTETLSADDAKKAQSFQGASGMTINIKDAGTQFASGSAALEPKAREYFQKLAEQWSYARQVQTLDAQSSDADRKDVDALRAKRILLVGHTDDTGSSALNAQLSEARARAVAEVFRSQGVSDAQLFFQGAGETLPVADNRSDAGRAQNRRVEIVDLGDEASFQTYLANRHPNLAFYRPAEERQPTVAAVAAPEATPEAMLPAAKPSPSRPSRPNRSTTTAATSPSGTLAPGASVSAPTSAQLVPAAAIDFGGTPVGGAVVHTADIGTLVPQRSSFSLISNAYADSAPPGQTCSQDRPRVAHGVKSLRNLQEIRTNEYLPGMYGTSWADNVNGHLVALTGVTVLRDGGEPASQPKVLVYKDYKPGTKVSPTFQTVAEVNTYRGQNALLYRVFIRGASGAGAPLQCVDLVLPYGGKEALDSKLVYARGSTDYVAAIKPHLAQ